MIEEIEMTEKIEMLNCDDRSGIYCLDINESFVNPKSCNTSTLHRITSKNKQLTYIT